MSFSPLIVNLIKSLQCLPGVGQKSAQRMAFHVLEKNREAGKRMANAWLEAIAKIRHCEQCRNLSETAVCGICQNPGRDGTKLCVVETPANVVAIEQTNIFKGHYFVLMGHLSPIDGVGPEEIGVPLFKEKIKNQVTEVILATSSTAEGEATAYYLAELVRKQGIVASRIAQGVPHGGDLDYVDGNTLSRALAARSTVDSGEAELED